jgi:hypothetical protein
MLTFMAVMGRSSGRIEICRYRALPPGSERSISFGGNHEQAGKTDRRSRGCDEGRINSAAGLSR